MIIEDEAIIALLLKDLLVSMGHDVRAIAHDVAEEVTAAATYYPDLMIVGVNLAGESGIVAVDTIQLLAPIPCIFFSGDVHILAMLAARGEVLAKPYQPL